MKTRTKIVVVIFLAILYFAFIQRISAPALAIANADLPKDLDKWYAGYNSEYFDDKLPKDTLVDWGEYDVRNMGSTTILPNGRFHIALNKKYCLADRTMRLVLLHEQCHIQTFSEITDDPKTGHGPRWRTCMLNLYQIGGFKRELIDGYGGRD